MLFLARGEIIYCGATRGLHAACAAASFLIPPHYNPSDYVMLQLQMEPQEKLLPIRKANLAALPPDEVPKHATHAAEKGAGERAMAALSSNGLCAPRAVQGSWPLQLWLLYRRESLNLFRNRGGLVARYTIPLFLNLLYGLIYYQAAKGDDITTHFGALVQIMISAMFGSAQPMILAFPLERPIFLRECAPAAAAPPANALPPFFWPRACSALRPS